MRTSAGWWSGRCRLRRGIGHRAARALLAANSARYEQASTVPTSNKGFEEWDAVLGDEVMAAALIDRLLHHCHVVNIRGNSYRMREYQELWESMRGRRTATGRAKAEGKTLGRTGEARCLFPLNVCNFQLPKVRNFRLPLTPANLRCNCVVRPPAPAPRNQPFQHASALRHGQKGALQLWSCTSVKPHAIFSGQGVMLPISTFAHP